MVGKLFADAADDVDIPTGFDFDLDALVAIGELAFDAGEEVVDGVVDAEGDAAGDFALRAPPPIFFQRGMFSARAARSQTAASTPPRAMLWPRMWAVRGATASGLGRSWLMTRGAT